MQKKLPSLSTTLEDPCITTISQATTKKGITSHILQFNLTAAAAPLRMLHARLHPLLRFYIDACSELEQTDERLEVLLAVQIEAGAPTAVLGMLTFFKCAPSWSWLLTRQAGFMYIDKAWWSL